MKKIYLVRHTQTYMNTWNRVRGWFDSPLTDVGQKEATHLGEKMQKVPFVEIWSSDSISAIATRDIIARLNNYADHINIKEDSSFRGEFMGNFEGWDESDVWSKIAKSKGYENQLDMIKHGYSLDELRDIVHESDSNHEAENAEMFWKRLDNGIEELRNLNQDGNYLIVTHESVIRSLVQKLSEGNFDESVIPANGSITTLLIDNNDQIVVDSYNELL